MLIERQDEIRRLAQARRDTAAAAGRVLVIEGPPGIGKTRLVGAARQDADGAGFRTLIARGGEQERQSAFGVVRELFAPLQRADDLFAGPAAVAAPLLGGPRSTEVAPADDFAVLHGLYWLLLNAAAKGPVLAVVDDAHWADEASLRFLEYALPRLEELPVMFLLALRPGDVTVDHPLRRVVARLSGAVRITPGPLSSSGAAELLAAAFGTAVAPSFAVACHEATGGNPFLLTTLASALAADGIRPDDAGALRVRHVGADRVGALVLPRLAALGSGAIALARAIAVLGDGARLRDAAAVAGLDSDDAWSLRDTLVANDVLQPAKELRFVHPLVRSAVYEELPFGQRSTLHARAADQLVAVGERPEDVARHLLRVEPGGNAEAVGRLIRGAQYAADRGAPEAAVAFLERALAEPPPAQLRSRILRGLAIAGTRMEHPESSRWALEALTSAADPVERARTLLDVGWVRGAEGEVGAALAWAFALVDEVRPADPELALRLEAHVLTATTMTLAGRKAGQERLRKSLSTELAGRTDAECVMLTVQALETACGPGPAARAEDLVRRALAGRRLITLLEGGPDWTFWLATWTLCSCGYPGETVEILDEGIAAARRRASSIAFAFASFIRSHAYTLLGDVRSAEADALAAVDTVGTTGAALALPGAYGCLIDALVQRGQLDAARQFVNRYECEIAPRQVPTWTDSVFLSARGQLELAEGTPEKALASFQAASAALPTEWTGPVSFPWRPGSARALLSLGRYAEAVAIAEQDVRIAEDYGLSHALGAALRTRGYVTAGEAGVADLRRAVDLLDAAPLDQAWARYELGTVLRRDRQPSDARRPLQQALDFATHSGALLLHQRALDQLRATGARPRRQVLSGVDALTARERRVAELAAEGLANREIAQALFITPKTVETHLGRVYTKLEVSRDQLAAVLAAQAAAGGRPRSGWPARASR